MVLGIFYYPWYGGKNNPESLWRHWKDNKCSPPITWNSRYLPDVSSSSATEDRLYDSFDQNILTHQMNLIKQAHIDFVIWSWWGQDSFSDHALKYFCNSNYNPSGLKHCIYYEKEWLENVPEEEIESDIKYIKRNYYDRNESPNTTFLRIDDKSVIFVYNRTPTKYLGYSNYQADLANKWYSIRVKYAIYTVLKISPGWQNYQRKSNSWHQYGPSTHYQKARNYSSYVSPGWWSPKEIAPRLPRDTTRFKNDVIVMRSDGTPIKTIQTWNEWTEGTGIEPAIIGGQSYGTIYLDIIKSVFG